ncbi:hypothetical protein [Gallaecimonas sp. GXIMD4217]|uniref:hypothetical protein n=1 Tax=Gallaecimonas sp. GXIMD4217 TaxID=3131927 RepID=UPI00311AD298
MAGFFLAIAGAGPGGVSAIFIFLGLALGAILSLFHSIFRYYKDENSKRVHLIASAIMLLLVGFPIVGGLIAESNCTTSKTDSFVKAKTYIEGLGWPLRFLKQDAHELSGCELGFEYESLEHFRLVIVSPDGQVRLNE